MKNPSHRVLELGVARGSAFWWAMDRMILSIFTGGSVFNVGMAQNRKIMEKNYMGMEKHNYYWAGSGRDY